MITLDTPIYCRTCKVANTWQPYDKANILSAENGKTIWQGFKCSGCGKTTIRLVDNEKKER